MKQQTKLQKKTNKNKTEKQTDRMNANSGRKYQQFMAQIANFKIKSLQQNTLSKIIYQDFNGFSVFLSSHLRAQRSKNMIHPARIMRLPAT